MRKVEAGRARTWPGNSRITDSQKKEAFANSWPQVANSSLRRGAGRSPGHHSRLEFAKAGLLRTVPGFFRPGLALSHRPADALPFAAGTGAYPPLTPPQGGRGCWSVRPHRAHQPSAPAASRSSVWGPAAWGVGVQRAGCVGVVASRLCPPG